MHAAAHGDAFARRSLGLGVHGHRHVALGWHPKAEPMVVQPPPIAPIPKAFVEDSLVQAGGIRQVGPRLREQRPQRERFIRLSAPLCAVEVIVGVSLEVPYTLLTIRGDCEA